jgi:hypothetical protein
MKLPTIAEVAEARRGKTQFKGLSRLEMSIAAKRLMVVDDKTFKRQVRSRDHFCCRKCRRKVQPTASRVPDRAEVHHVHGRHGDLRFEERCAILLCLKCHEGITGRINERWIIVPTQTFTMPQYPGRELCDARQPVTFERIA